MRIFDRQDWLRVNRARARIKVLVDRIGIDAFREMVEEELEGDWVAERDFSIEHLLFIDDEEAEAPAPPQRLGRTATAREFERFREANVRPQRQAGFSTVAVKVTRGDLTPEQFRGLGADHARLHRRLRAHHRPAEPRSALGARRGVYDVWRRLRDSSSATPARTRSRTWSSCPGTDSCKLGITGSMGLNQGDPGSARGDGAHRPAHAQIHIKMRGCPNGCSQHHIANIGFYGASIKVGGRPIPAYIAHLGGKYEGGEVG